MIFPKDQRPSPAHWTDGQLMFGWSGASTVIISPRSRNCIIEGMTKLSEKERANGTQHQINQINLQSRFISNRIASFPPQEIWSNIVWNTHTPKEIYKKTISKMQSQHHQFGTGCIWLVLLYSGFLVFGGYFWRDTWLSIFANEQCKQLFQRCLMDSRSCMTVHIIIHKHRKKLNIFYFGIILLRK